MKELSYRQRQILDFIRDYTRRNGYPPSIRQIASKVGITSTSVVDYNLNVLEREGYIRRDPETSRGIEMMERTVVEVPILGRIAAGRPIEAITAAEPLLLTRDIAPEGAYALQVEGTSMIEDHIDNGDLVVVQPRSDVDNGDTVVALLRSNYSDRGEATLKRFYLEKEAIRLQPRNAREEPIWVKPGDVQVQGKVVAVIRRLA